ncbi:helix-turn-helix domain-containing protein [Streptomyces sp. NPDC056361]|uniref:helix-turn-helix domain-containing protein n=1 Tax=Streptomyces sp. NPDC056361 TaxID=3345795 RepID=UPI0035D797FF
MVCDMASSCSGRVKMKVIQPDFGRRLKRIRLERGLSQAALAHGPLSSSYVSRLECGLRLPSPDMVRHLAERLGVSEDDLLNAEPEEGERKSVLAEAATALSDQDFSTVVALLDPQAPEWPGQGEDEWLWQALWCRAQAQAGLGDKAGRVLTLHALRDLTRESAVRFPHVRLLLELAAAERAAAHLDEARTVAGEAVGLLSEAPVKQPVLLARAMVLLASVETECGLLALAGTRIPRLLELTEQLPDQLRTEVLWTCSTVRVRQGLSDEGMALLTSALEQADPKVDILIWARLRLAAVSLHLRCFGLMTEESRKWLAQATDALAYVGSASHQAELQSVTARVHLLDGRPAEAVTMALAAEESGRLSFQDALRTKLLRARATAESTDSDAGLAVMREVAAEAERVGYLDLAAETWKEIATFLGGTQEGPASAGP